MKKLFILFAIVAASMAAKAQISPYPMVPAVFNYQGVARNSAGQPLANQSIKVYSSIITPAGGGFALNRFYMEKRTVTTNSFGLFNIQIGSPGADSVGGTMPANSTFSAFTNLNLHTDIVLPNTTALISLGDTKMNSVPYALYARAARPWAYIPAEPNGTNFTIYPDKDYWNLGLGTTEATEKLHVKGSIRMDDGRQAAGYVMTSDADGVGSWKPNGNISPWAKGGNRTFLITNSDSVGIGTINPTAKLHVAGKFRLADGTQNVGYNLTSDGAGLASWQKPNWTEYSNNIGVGYNIIYATDTNKTVGIGTAIPDGRVKLHVDGGLRLTGNGPVLEDNILTVNASGNAVWKSLGNNLSSFWVPGFRNGRPTVESRPLLDTQAFYSNSRFVVDKQVPLQAGVPASLQWFNTDNYPLQVVGSTNGMSIKVNSNGPATGNNKFISFFGGTNQSNFIAGRIEGQTYDELQNDLDYVFKTVINALLVGGFAAEAIACAAQVDLFEVVALGIQGAAFGAQLGSEIAAAELNVGVNYASGAGDYAEWLERADHSEKFIYGEIVSVRGGKISKNTDNEGQLMVISMAPVVIGNMPEEKNEKYFEKVAFMGQVPVVVIGPVSVGDYIIANGKNDGKGYAVHPEKITSAEQKKIVGVAWSASAGSPVSMINVAVGINTHATTHTIEKQENEISLLKEQFNQVSAYLQSKDPAYNYTKLETSSTSTPSVSPSVYTGKEKQTAFANPLSTDGKSLNGLTPEQRLRKLMTVSTEQVKKIITDKPEYLEASMKVLREKIEAANPASMDNPEMKRLFTDRPTMIAMAKKLYGIR